MIDCPPLTQARISDVANLRDLVAHEGAQKTYVMQFSEETPHLHFSVVPRMPDIPDDRKGFAVAQYNAGEVQSNSERDAIALQLTEGWRSALPY